MHATSHIRIYTWFLELNRRGLTCAWIFLMATGVLYSVPLCQGLSFVCFPDQPEHFLRDDLGGISVTRPHNKSAQVELKSGRVSGPVCR